MTTYDIGSITVTLTKYQFRILCAISEHLEKCPLMCTRVTIDGKYVYVFHLYIYLINQYLPILIDTKSNVNIIGNLESPLFPLYQSITCSEFELLLVSFIFHYGMKIYVQNIGDIDSTIKHTINYINDLKRSIFNNTLKIKNFVENSHFAPVPTEELHEEILNLFINFNIPYSVQLYGDTYPFIVNLI